MVLQHCQRLSCLAEMAVTEVDLPQDAAVVLDSQRAVEVPMLLSYSMTS